MSICNVLQPPLYIHGHSLQICLNTAVYLILMVQHLSLSHALSRPSLLSPAAVTEYCFSLPCITSVRKGVTYLSGQAGNTSGDRGNVDWVTSYASTAPTVLSSANHREGIHLYSVYSALSHLFGFSTEGKYVKRMHKKGKRIKIYSLKGVDSLKWLYAISFHC